MGGWAVSPRKLTLHFYGQPKFNQPSPGNRNGRRWHGRTRGLSAQTQAPCSISQLAAGSALTRQAITKHLRVLEEARLVQSEVSGRENLFELKTEPLISAQDYLNEISQQWDAALTRLKAFVER